MKSERHSIFRAEALRHYARNRDKAALPESIGPRTFTAFWILLSVLLIAGAALSWYARDLLFAQPANVESSR